MKRLVLLPLLFVIAFPASAGEKARTLTVDQIVASDARFSTLDAALEVSGLAEVLAGEGPFTVFAPTNDAFRALPPTTLEALLLPENAAQLRSVLTFHVVPGRIFSEDLLSSASARTAQGSRLPIGLSIEGVSIVQTDIEADNGVIHVIDAVLIPRLEPFADRRSPASDARSVIEFAIDRGVPLYNSGNARACAAIYEIAATALLAEPNLGMTARRALRRGLERADAAHSVDDRAWRLREGLDAAYRALGRRVMSESAGH